MGWSIGFDENNKRDIGYGVPAICDHPGCKEGINRGLSYVCGGAAYGGDKGCGLFFCGDHRLFSEYDEDPELCSRCCDDEPPFDPSPDTYEWCQWKLNDESWQVWRDENKSVLEKLRAVKP